MSSEPRRHRVSDGFRRAGIIAWAIIGLLVLAAIAGWAFLQVRTVFPPLVLALVTIFLLNPAVAGLEKRGVPRLAGSCLAYIVVLGLLAAVLTFLVPLLVHQGQGFVDDFPETVERVSDLADRVTDGIQSRFPSFDLGEWISRRFDLLGDNLGRIGGFLLGAVQTIALLIVGPIIAFYLLVDLPRLQRSAMSLIPPDRRAEVHQVAGEVSRTMGSFFRGQLFVALIVGVLSSVGMAMIGLPYWAVVGMTAGLFNLVPLIGPFIGAIPGLLIAGAMKPPITMVWVALIMTAVQQIDNHFISPNVMRFTVRLHPATVMASLIVGATVAGFWGMLLAVPTMASVKLIAAHLWRTRVPWGAELFARPEPGVARVPPGGPDAAVEIHAAEEHPG